MPKPPTVVVDCRWLGIGGPGRTTELMLRGLAEDPPAGRWILWGPREATAALAWPGADVRQIAGDPRVLLGQRHAFDLPRADFSVFLHQQRPLRRLRSATVVYDTIPLRHGTGAVSRALKRRFLQRVVDTSQQIITISEHSKASIMRDLGVPDARIELVRFPFDDAFAERVLTLRKAVARRDIALFVGGFLPHKNLPRLLAAFAATRFCAGGGELVLVAGTPEQARTFADGLDARQRGYVRVRPPCPQADLDELFATSLFLVQPSLEEGFGLPAWEALCCGLPVCVSEGGALPEVTKGYADPFPATSTAAMAAAIDRCAATARGVDAEAASDLSARVRADAPTVRQFGARFAGVVARNVVAQ